jgi:hypothetical protein
VIDLAVEQDRVRFPVLGQVFQKLPVQDFFILENIRFQKQNLEPLAGALGGNGSGGFPQGGADVPIQADKGAALLPGRIFRRGRQALCGGRKTGGNIGGYGYIGGNPVDRLRVIVGAGIEHETHTINLHQGVKIINSFFRNFYFF